MPSVIVFSRTEKARDYWKNEFNRDMLQTFLREYAARKQSLAVEGFDLLVDHMSSDYPQDPPLGEPDVLLEVWYSIREGGIVRMEGGTSTFTGDDTARLLKEVKAKFPDLIWGVWYLPQFRAGYSQG